MLVAKARPRVWGIVLGGGELVRRSGRYGDFMGCASYPRCKYMRGL